MADRFPLIVDSTTNQIKEIENGDNLNLSGNNIINASNVNAIGDINTASDIKLKINIKEIDNPLDKILKLRGVEYDRIDMNNKHQIGVIAQEVERVIPELISEIENTKTVSYGNITAVLI